MPASGSSIFTNADGYQASLQDMLDLLILHPRRFHARLTWVELENINLLRAEEASARIAYVRLPPERVFVTFVTNKADSLVSGGIDLQFGDLLFHSGGELLHQRTTAACRWASISLTPSALIAYGRSIAGLDLAAPMISHAVRPNAADCRELLRLHAQAGRIAETDLRRIIHREVVRALEQDVSRVLINCLVNGEMREPSIARRRQAEVSIRFEAMLSSSPGKQLRIRDVCGTIGISEQVLRRSCARLFGMGPARYQRLWRLRLARTGLSSGRAISVDAAEIVNRYGFANLHRFVTEYWEAYGEMPPFPPRDAD